MDATDAEPKVLLELRDIEKRFPGSIALKSVSFEIRLGEVQALLGENGAGKSTLMKILAGEYRPTAGEIIVGGRSVSYLTPDLATQLGIGLVHQELSLVPALSVTENIYLGRLPRTALGTVDWTSAHAKARAALAKLGVSIETRMPVGRLEVAEQQLVEIARILDRDPQIVLFDEPTSALSDGERTRLFEVIRRLKQQGHGIIYISHHLSEIPEIADRVTVLRDGNVAATLPIAEADEARIISLMVGHRLSEQYPKIDVQRGEVAIRAVNIASGRALKDLSFDLHRGEILGIYGLMGAGQADIARALFGLEPLTAGDLFVEGKPMIGHDAAAAIEAGMGLISRDRRQSLVPMLPMGPNIGLAWLSRRSPISRLETKRESAESARYIDDMKIRPPSLVQKLLYFSGGNQQKVVLARWMSSGARILIFDEPTRGIDVAAKADVFALMTRLAEQGAAIMMISSEINELIGMADRVLIIQGGRLARELPRGDLTEESLLMHAS